MRTARPEPQRAIRPPQMGPSFGVLFHFIIGCNIRSSNKRFQVSRVGQHIIGVCNRFFFTLPHTRISPANIQVHIHITLRPETTICGTQRVAPCGKFELATHCPVAGYPATAPTVHSLFPLYIYLTLHVTNNITG
ncbi:hypothetical protein SFRURICE_016380 [Spodoptera frugiperda]|nr:hypothetical protein SFRURICE_016380 [Spodoptera frugiperda]